MKYATAIVLAFVAAMVAWIVDDIRSEAHASPGAGVAMELAHGAAAVGPGFTASWSFTCGTTASNVVPPGTQVVAFECFAPEPGETDASQMIAFGASDVGDPTSAPTGNRICGTGCNRSSVAINAKQGKCRSDTDDVLVTCWGVTGQTVSQP